ncbi:MAG: serpin family protein [Sphingobium sp.]
MKIRFIHVVAALQLAAFGGGALAQPADDAAARVGAAGVQVVADMNRFTLDLYKASVVPSENIFLSPASVSTAVGLAYRGAKGATADELRAVFHYSSPPLDHLVASAPVLDALDVSGDGGELRLSNALWIQEGVPLLPDYLADVTAHARAGVRRVDYRADTEGARQTINQWVAASTNDRIRDLLQPNDVNDRTRATLVNTIYWKGRWAAEFGTGATKIEPFTRLDGKKAPVSLMHQKASFRVLERDGVQAIRLPYAHGAVSLIVLMPRSPSALTRFERKLTADGLARWIGDLAAAEPRETVLSLPKMHLECREDLVPTLTTLGANIPFGDSSDFSGITREPDAGGDAKAANLQITKIIHQTFLDVDEMGSEAAAATAVAEDVYVTAKAMRPPKPVVFRADKPFLFLLHDGWTGAILFIGRHVAPAPPG